MKKQFKVGDQVRLKKNLKVGNSYGKYSLTLLHNMVFEGFKPILNITNAIELKSSHSDLIYSYAQEMLTKKL